MRVLHAVLERENVTLVGPISRNDLDLLPGYSDSSAQACLPLRCAVPSCRRKVLAELNQRHIYRRSSVLGYGGNAMGLMEVSRGWQPL